MFGSPWPSESGVDVPVVVVIEQHAIHRRGEASSGGDPGVCLCVCVPSCKTQAAGCLWSETRMLEWSGRSHSQGSLLGPALWHQRDILQAAVRARVGCAHTMAVRVGGMTRPVRRAELTMSSLAGAPPVASRTPHSSLGDSYGLGCRIVVCSPDLPRACACVRSQSVTRRGTRSRPRALGVVFVCNVSC